MQHLLWLPSHSITLLLRSTAMTLQDIEHQLLALPAADKASAIQLLTQSLGSPWRSIEKTPGVCGGSACIASTRIPVWGLVEAR